MSEDVEKMARTWVKEYAQQLPGGIDFFESVECFKAGFLAAQEIERKRAEEFKERLVEDGD